MGWCQLQWSKNSQALSDPWAEGSTVSRVWTASLSAPEGIELANATLSVKLSGVTDRAGNAGTGTSAASARLSIDTKRPEMRIVVGGESGGSGAAGSRTVTITVSEALNRALRRDDFSWADATLSELTSTDQLSWSGTLTPNSKVERVENRIWLRSQDDLTDRAGNHFAQEIGSNSFALDNVGPRRTSIYSSGNQLVLVYEDESGLDAGNPPANSAFTVLVDGQVNAVTGVRIGDRGGGYSWSVTLTLSRSVAADQRVQLSYRDPTPGDDAHAIQDTAGNDAAGFTVDVTSLETPAGEAKPPMDGDRLSATMEDQVPGLPGPNGAAAVRGDGNGDGVADSLQSQVGSIRLALSHAGASNPAGAPTTWATLVVASQDGKVSANPGEARIVDLEQKDAPAGLPRAMMQPTGPLKFTVHTQSKSGGASTGFSLYVDTALGVNGYWAMDSSGVWVNLASSPYGGKTVLEGTRLRFDFSITDGGQFDSDKHADGHIDSVGAAGQMALSIVGLAPDAGQQTGFWF